MLRVVPSFFAIKLWGVLVMFGAIVVLFLVPWLDKSPVQSYRYRGKLSWAMLAIFVISFLWLGKLGAGPGTAIRRASCRERGCQSVWIMVVAVSLKQKTQ